MKEYFVGDEMVIAVSSKIGKNPKLIDEVEEMRIDYLMKQENSMLQDVKLENGQVIENFKVKLLKIVNNG